MAIDPNVVNEINVASSTLQKVLADVSLVVPPTTPAGIAISSASILLPLVINSILTAVMAAEAHAAKPMPVQPVAAQGA